MRITISGTPGSGKSTVAKLLVKKLKYPYLNAGQIFREAAEKRGATLAEFAHYVAQHPDIDRKLDRTLVERAKQHEDCILEGRLAGWMTKRMRIPALRVWITARESVRVDRLMEREGGTREETLRKLRERAVGEAQRYRRLYRVDLSSIAPYDMVIHTDQKTPEEVAALILNAMHAKSGDKG